MKPKENFSSATTLAGRELAPRIVRDGSRCWHILGSNLALVAVLAMSGGCENAQQGAVSGAGIGALSGLAIGSLTGNAGRGAATGAIIGGVGGAAIGDQNRRRNEEAARQSPQPAQTIVVQQQPVSVAVTAQPSYQTGSALGRLVGQWNISGTIDGGNGTMLPVHGTARATVDLSYFVRLDLHFTDPRSGEVVDRFVLRKPGCQALPGRDGRQRECHQLESGHSGEFIPAGRVAPVHRHHMDC